MMKRGFLIMPFSKDLNWLHEEIVAAGIDAGVDVERADSIFSPGVILDQIFKAIDEADVVIAVCTGKNANVFFELGYAWQKHDPVLIANDTDDLPFDVKHLRVELYGREEAGAHRRTLRPRMRKAMEAVLEAERLPRGRRLVQAPERKQQARLSGRLDRVGSRSRLVITNTGTAELSGVDAEAPSEASGFHLMSDGPVDVLRPGESIELPVATAFGGGPRIFDVIARGKTPDGEIHEFPIKISL